MDPKGTQRTGRGRRFLIASALATVPALVVGIVGAASERRSGEDDLWVLDIVYDVLYALLFGLVVAVAYLIIEWLLKSPRSPIAARMRR